MRILLADDERNFRTVLYNELDDDGYRIDVVADGVEAVLKFIEGRHDFLLFDIKMPKLDGINALRIIRKIDPSVAAITFSGNAGTGEMADSIKAGALRCFTKPFEVASLREEIRKFEARRRTT